MAGFKWSLDWDTNPLRRGGEQAATALEGAIDTFKDMAVEADRATGKAGDSLASDVKDGGRTAERAVADLEDAFRETARKAQEYTRDTGKALGDDVKDGAGRAGEHVQTFREEASQNFSEVASSFTGDMSQAADGVQGILGGLASAIPGPVGLISGFLAGIGGAMLASFTTSSEASKQVVSDMYDDMLASGLNFLSKDAAQRQISAIIKGEDGAITTLAKAQDIAKRSGQELGTVLAGLTGDTESQTRVQQGLADALAATDSQIEWNVRGQRNMSDEQKALRTQFADTQTAQQLWSDALGTTNTRLDDARTKVGAARDAADKLAGAFQSTSDSAARVSQGIAGIPGNVTVKFDVDDSAVRAWAARPVQVNAVARVGTPQVT